MFLATIVVLLLCAGARSASAHEPAEHSGTEPFAYQFTSVPTDPSTDGMPSLAASVTVLSSAWANENPGKSERSAEHLYGPADCKLYEGLALVTPPMTTVKGSDPVANGDCMTQMNAWVAANPLTPGNRYQLVVTGEMDFAWGVGAGPTQTTLYLDSAVYEWDVTGGQMYYVRTDGDDLNTGLSPGSAFATITKGAASASAGDYVFVGSGTYLGSDGNHSINPGANGTAVAPIKIIADTSGSVTDSPPGDVTVDGMGAFPADGNGLFKISRDYTIVDGFTVTGSAGFGVHAKGMVTDNVVFRNMVSHSNANDGFNILEATGISLINNLSYNNGDNGFETAGLADNIVFRNNTSYNNTNNGFQIELPDSGTLLFKDNIADELAASDYAVKISVDNADHTNIAADPPNYNMLRAPLGSYQTCGPNCWDTPGPNDLTIDPELNDPDGADDIIGTEDDDFRLRQIAAGQTSQSPAVDSGSNTAAALGMDSGSTRTDDVDDSGPVDRGYHYLKPQGGGKKWYVRTSLNGGDDLNSCLAPTSACASIHEALSRAVADGSGAGDTIIVASGTYVTPAFGPKKEGVFIDTGGTIADPLVVLADTDGIYTPDPAGKVEVVGGKRNFFVGGSNIVIDGFTMRNPATYSNIYIINGVSVSNLVFRNLDLSFAPSHGMNFATPTQENITIENLVVHDTGSGGNQYAIILRSTSNSVLKNITVYNHSGTQGVIEFGSGATGNVVRDIRVYNSPLAAALFVEGGSNNSFSNIVSNGNARGIFLTGVGTLFNTFDNLTIYGSTVNGVRITPSSGNSISNSIIAFNSGSGIDDQCGGCLIHDNNLLYANAAGNYAGSASQAPSEIVGIDPYFADADGPDEIASTADDDFRLQHIAAGWPNNSAAIDAGNDTAANRGLSSPYTTRTDGVSDGSTGVPPDITVDLGYHYTTGSGGPPLSVVLTPVSASGFAPHNNVDLETLVSGDDGITPIDYDFDCDDSAPPAFDQQITTMPPYDAVDLCDYASDGIYTATVQVTQGARTAGDSKPITVAVPPPAANIYATPSTVPYGGLSTISWNSTSVSTCTVSYPDEDPLLLDIDSSPMTGDCTVEPRACNYNSINPGVAGSLEGPFIADTTVTISCDGGAVIDTAIITIDKRAPRFEDF